MPRKIFKLFSDDRRLLDFVILFCQGEGRTGTAWKRKRADLPNAADKSAGIGVFGCIMELLPVQPFIVHRLSFLKDYAVFVTTYSCKI